MDGLGEFFIDEQGRTVRWVLIDGELKKYYAGKDGNGVIQRNEQGEEYIVVDGQKRYWRRERSFSIEGGSERFSEFVFFMLKPDAVRLDICQEVILSLRARGFTVVAERPLKFHEELVCRFYCEFMDRDWCQELIEYFCSQSALCLLLKPAAAPEEALRILREIKTAIREKYGANGNTMKNLVHCPDSPEESLREMLLIFGKEFLSGLYN